MNTKQRNYYEHVIVNQMNRFASYMNYLSDFGKEYNKAIDDLCKENNCNIEDVNISQELIDFKKQIESSYDKAKSFYKDLEYIRNQNRSLMDIDYLIRSFNTRVNLAKFPIPKNITLQFINNTVIKKGYVAKTDYSEDLKKLEKEIFKDLKDIRKKIHKDLDNVKYSEIINKKEELLSDINALEKDVKDYIAQIQEVNNNDDDFFQQKSMELILLSAKRKEYYDQAEYLRLRALQLKWDERVKKNKAWGEDAAAIWKLASSKFTEGLDYIQENGYLLQSITELNNKELENELRKKLEKQIEKSDAKVLVLNENSTLSKHISKDLEFIIFIKNNLDKLKKYKQIKDTSLNFDVRSQSTTNSHLALHRCDVKDIYLDDNSIVHALIVDTIDYNFGEAEVKELNELQKVGLIENYIIITKISLPLDFYSNYYNLNKLPYFYGMMK